ncbi:MAG: acylphosphatase [Chromatiales bacterium]|nr:MAG: acylphosphatase [Chromatiales bacterium]
MSHEARLFTIYGRVQGVWFRDSTRREAQRLAIAGHAINLPDGNVEVLACGAPDALRELETWLQSGPPLASVSRVDSVVVEATPTTGFRIG